MGPTGHVGGPACQLLPSCAAVKVVALATHTSGTTAASLVGDGAGCPIAVGGDAVGRLAGVGRADGLGVGVWLGVGLGLASAAALGLARAGTLEIAGAGSLELATAVDSDGSAGGGLGTGASLAGDSDPAALLSR